MPWFLQSVAEPLLPSQRRWRTIRPSFRGPYSCDISSLAFALCLYLRRLTPATSKTLTSSPATRSSYRRRQPRRSLSKRETPPTTRACLTDLGARLTAKGYQTLKIPARRITSCWRTSSTAMSRSQKCRSKIHRGRAVMDQASVRRSWAGYKGSPAWPAWRDRTVRLSAPPLRWSQRHRGDRQRGGQSIQRTLNTQDAGRRELCLRRRSTDYRTRCHSV